MTKTVYASEPCMLELLIDKILLTMSFKLVVAVALLAEVGWDII